MALSPEVLALQAEQIRKQVVALSEQIDRLYVSSGGRAIDQAGWAFCNAYLHTCQTPLQMVVGRLESLTPAAVAADPRA